MRLRAVVREPVSAYDGSGDGGGDGLVVAAGAVTMTQLGMDVGSATLADVGDAGGAAVAAMVMMVVLVVLVMEATGRVHGRQGLL